MVNSIGLSASYNVMEAEEADAKAAKKFEDDICKGRECITLPFYRSEKDVKFYYPIYKQVPLVAYMLISAIKEAEKVSVCGPKELEAIVAESAKALDAEQKVSFVCESESPSYASTIRKLLESCNGSNRRESIGIVSGDLVLAYNLISFLQDEDADNADLVLDFNGRERIFSDIEEFFRRNYYDHFVVGDETVHVKEPNMFHINGRGIDAFDTILGTAYASRKGGRTAAKMLSKVLQIAAAHPVFAYRGMRYIMNREKHPVDVEMVSEGLNWVMRTATARIKVEHRDPFRIRDVDGLQDLNFYKAIFAEAERRGVLEQAYPYTAELKAVNEAMQPLRSSFPMLDDYQDFMIEKIERINRHLKKVSLSNGTIYALQSTDNIRGAVDFLLKNYAPAFRKLLFQRGDSRMFGCHVQ